MSNEISTPDDQPMEPPVEMRPDPQAAADSVAKHPFMCIRPQSQDPSRPFYAPERDVAIQAPRILGEVELLIRTPDRVSHWWPVYETLRTLHGHTGDPLVELNKAGMACLEYVADCRGQVYKPGAHYTAWPLAEVRLTYPEAWAKLTNQAPRAALEFIMMLQGYFLMDFYCMGAAQSSQYGVALDRSVQEVFSILDSIGRAMWSGQDSVKQMTSDLRKTVAAAMQMGISAETIHSVVNNEAAKV